MKWMCCLWKWNVNSPNGMNVKKMIMNISKMILMNIIEVLMNINEIILEEKINLKF